MIQDALQRWAGSLPKKVAVAELLLGNPIAYKYKVASTVHIVRALVFCRLNDLLRQAFLLSNEGLIRFCRFFLEVCLDQVEYMGDMLRLEELVLRIDQRVERMFAGGLVDEVRQLLAGSHPPGRTAAQAVGYREVIEHLGGVRDLAATVDLVKLRTRQFAKRQMTWFRSLSECRWVAVRPDASPEELAEGITL